jgi:hypothetical protein
MKLGSTLRTIESSQGCWHETLTGSFLQGAEVCTFVPSLYAMREVMPVMPATLRLVTAYIAIPYTYQPREVGQTGRQLLVKITNVYIRQLSF